MLANLAPEFLRYPLLLSQFDCNIEADESISMQQESILLKSTCSQIPI